MPEVRRPNWDKWKLIPQTELWKVVALSVDIDPDFVRLVTDSLFLANHRQPRVEARDFTDRLAVSVANLNCRTELTRSDSAAYRSVEAKIRIAHFAHFAVSIGWGLPQEFPVAIYVAKWRAKDAWGDDELRDLLCGLEPNVGRSGFTEINEAAEDIRRAVLAGELMPLESPLAKQGGVLYGSNRHFRPADATDWATRIADRFPKFPFRVSDFESPISDASPAPIEKHLHTKEKETLLKLVIGMAVKGFDYDPLAPRGPAPAMIAASLEGLEIGLDQDTIRKWLREGAKLLPRHTGKTQR